MVSLCQIEHPDRVGVEKCRIRERDQWLCFPSKLKHRRTYTTTKQHKIIWRSSNPVTCRTSTDPCRVYTIQIQVTQPPWPCTTVRTHVLIGGTTGPPLVSRIAANYNTWSHLPVSAWPLSGETGPHHQCQLTPSSANRPVLSHPLNIKSVQIHQSEHLRQPKFPYATMPVK